MNLKSHFARIACVSFLVLAAACGRYEEFESVKSSARNRTQSPAAPTPMPAPVPTVQATKLPPIAAPEKPSGPITAQALPAPASAPTLPQLKVVAGGTTLVAKGETLFAVSRRTGVDVTDLISANELQPPYGVRAGQSLKIPPLRYHRIEQGETVSSIARRYDVTLLDIVRINNLAEPYAVVMGQHIKLPSDEAEMIALAPPLKIPAPAVAVRPKPVAPIPTPTPVPTPVQPKPPVVATIPAPVVVPAPLPAPAATPLAPAATIAEAPRFIWPVRGRVVAGFGDLGNGRYNDGVNLAVTRGEAVKVAADGVVLFAQTMRGFGNLILVRHAGNWLTAYGHNDVLLVSRGTVVKRGETIARAGQSGTVSSPQLHFEVRRGSKPLNPLQYLPSRDGV
jgi:murein DD-endopeptidase MepM/ murein hydrolase activator NlpD